MGKSVSASEYEAAKKRMSTCPDKTCANHTNDPTAAYCRGCRQAHKTAKEYERLNRAST